MTAPQPIRSAAPSRATPGYRSRPRRAGRRSHLLAQSPKALGLEVAAKLAVNLLLLSAVISALLKLVPYFQDQRSRLQEIETALVQAETETTQSRSDFSRYFDPTQANSIMQEQSGRKSPRQLTVVWTEPDYSP